MLDPRYCNFPNRKNGQFSETIYSYYIGLLTQRNLNVKVKHIPMIALYLIQNATTKDINRSQKQSLINYIVLMGEKLIKMPTKALLIT